MTVRQWQHPGTGTVIRFDDRRAAPMSKADAEFVLPAPIEVAAHEAGHAAAALLLGLPVLEARADWPGLGSKDAGHILGYIRHGEMSETPSNLRKLALVTLVGDIGLDRDAKAVGYAGAWPPAWPPTDKLGRDSDEAQLAEYVKVARLDESGWHRLCADAMELASRRDFARLRETLAILLSSGVVLKRGALEDLRTFTLSSACTKSNTLTRKSFEVSETATALDESGTFSALVAVFGNVDKGGDRIVPGAFRKTLDRWRASGDPIPVVFNHDWANPHAHVGVVDPHEARETPRGLFVKGKLDIEDNDVARQVHRLMQRRSLREFSFGYSVPAGGQTRAKDGANELLEIDLAEVGPTLKGMNPATELHSVKAALAAANPDRLSPSALRKKCRDLEVELLADGIATDPRERGPSVPTIAELNAQTEALGMGLPKFRDPDEGITREQWDSWFGRGDFDRCKAGLPTVWPRRS